MTTMEEFKKSGFTIIRNLVDPNETTRLYDYTLKNMEGGDKDDGQVPGSPSFYQDKEIAILQKKLLPKIEASIQVKLLTVFCYHRIYRTGAVLRAHKDSTRAEISATINLGQHGTPWDLWLLDYNENAHCVTLTPGDALIYYGHHLTHWRGKLEKADCVSQAMFHFVNKHGKNTFAVKLEAVRKIRKRCRQLFGIAY